MSGRVYEPVPIVSAIARRAAHCHSAKFAGRLCPTPLVLDTGEIGMSSNLNEAAAAAPMQAFGPFAPAIEYMVDATQRNVLFWDVMRQRGNQYHEHMAKVAPHVLSYGAEIVIDGRTLERPVNYALARIIPPKGVDIDQRRRPFV